MTTKKIGFIGLGLIGGSIAKAIRQYYPDYRIVAFNKSKGALALATSDGTIDVACSSIDENFADCDYIFLCAPVTYNTAYLKDLIPYLNDRLIITDVGSVKTPIHREAEKLDLGRYFIGGHPMAGSEKTGFENAKANLIENAYYIITPSPASPREKVDDYLHFADTLHALPLELNYEDHDRATGTISHLPHIIASSLVNYVCASDSKDELMKQLAAGGFKDITRIASSDPTMWENICEQNRENISRILGGFIDYLTEAKKMVETGNNKGIYDMFEHSKNYRNSMPGGSAGALRKEYAFYCDIPDEPGVIAIIATIVATNGISLKNIGIVHNREYEQGVLRIEFYDNDSCATAIELLKNYRYTIYEI